MKHSNLILKTILLIVVSICTTNISILIAQKSTLSKVYKDQVINLISEELKARYVFPEVAEKSEVHLQKLNQRGHFERNKRIEEFSAELTKAIYSITNDKHISIDVKQNKETTLNEADEKPNWKTDKLKGRTFLRRYNANFKSVTKTEENIGILDLRGFYGLDKGRRFADHSMAMLSTSDAIIIDLRNNSGGRGDMVNYLLGYFFEDAIITGKSIKRRGNNFTEKTSQSTKSVNGKKLPDTPLFILTSKKTFSAAEAFSYPMQVYDRATFIGETTKGGANAGDLISINDELEIFIPDVAALPHPVSNSMFEGIGIIPDIKVESDKAMDVALEQARLAAEEYKTELGKKAKSAIENLDKIVSDYEGQDPDQIVNAYLVCHDHDIIFEEWELNSFGYNLLSDGKNETALAVFKTNTILYPNAPNTFDSYAETLLDLGKTKEAVLNYEKAVTAALKYGNENLELHRENLKNAKSMMKKKN